MGKNAKVPKPQPTPAPPDPNADAQAKDAQAEARTNATRRSSKSLASGSPDDNPAPTSAPQLKSTLGGGTTQQA